MNSSSKKKAIGFLVGLGFLLPSIVGILMPTESAAKYHIALQAQPALDQYRTMAILVAALGIFICIGSLKEPTYRYSLFLAAFLVFSLLLGRVVSALMGSITNMLLIESAIELIALILLIWAMKVESV